MMSVTIGKLLWVYTISVKSSLMVVMELQYVHCTMGSHTIESRARAKSVFHMTVEMTRWCTEQNYWTKNPAWTPVETLQKLRKLSLPLLYNHALSRLSACAWTINEPHLPEKKGLDVTLLLLLIAHT